ncbi:Spo0E family sporulation regulatory protein-aspartic acid phosphatase [Clostridium sp.]|uniref:Spo0E family sporulation regulatory protein-aspartic acid phosphatase n=1 Tax=Clostridium sp. TaxID=1506 RepID=UPI002849B00F|nr:Spo0E family sporulation regulatory protein-aspartic acid phosphatase [Clostridium sp.]MDR3596695.1 Spo0E family sporulation regulatory protein-aspartic acid phosphatase [Clostridium sp.]
MRVLCDNCNLNCHIEKYKERLDNIIIRKNYNLLDNEVISLSQFLDDLIAKCIFCDTNNLHKFNKKNSIESEMLYYYGKQHLFLKLYYYISEGIKNDELIYISMEEGLYTKLMETLIINRVPINHIKFKSLEDITLRNNEFNVIALKEKVDKLNFNSKNDDIIIRWVIEPRYVSEVNLKKYFFDTKATFNRYMGNIKSNIMYIYDACEHINKGKNTNLSCIENKN